MSRDDATVLNLNASKRYCKGIEVLTFYKFDLGFSQLLD